MGILPIPFSELFQIHGSKTKLHPVCDLSQACVSGITQTMLLFGICKDALNGFFPCLVHPLIDRCVPGIICQFLVFFPDVPGNALNTILAVRTKMSGGTTGTDLWIAFVFPVTIPVGGAVIQYLVLRTDDTVEMFVIYILPPFVSALHSLGTLVGCG